MITSSTIIKRYNSDIFKQCAEDNKRINTYKKIATLNKTILTRSNDLKRFSNFESLTLSEIKSDKELIFTNSLPAGFNKEEFKKSLRSYILAKRTISDLQANVKQTKKSLIDEEVFKCVIKHFNKKLIDKIIYEQFCIEFEQLGKLLIYVKPANPSINKEQGFIKYRINWAETNKVKKAIIERGGTPYSKENAPDGEKYFVYNLDDTPFFHWTKTSCTLPNKRFYSFTTSRGTTSNVAKLFDYIKENSTNIEKYPRYDKKFC